MIGQFVISKAGHDKGEIYVIVAEEKDFVYLSDGRLKLPEKPKKKRRKHIQPITRTLEDTLTEQLKAGESVQAEKIKYAIRQYLKAR
mgnify:FL=1